MSNHLARKQSSKDTLLLSEFKSVIPVTVTCSWNYAKNLTDKTWISTNKLQSSGLAATDVDNSAYYDASSMKELSQKQIMKSNLYDLQHYFKKSPDNRVILMAALQKIKDTEQEAAATAYRNTGTTLAICINPNKKAAPRMTSDGKNTKAKK